MKTTFKLFNFLGAPVEISLWFFLLFLMTSVSTTIGIFLSVLIHEMAHAYIAHRRGWKVFGIKLDFLFGTAKLDMSMPEKDSIPVVVAGPLSNLIFAIFVFILIDLFYMFGFYLDPVISQFLNTLLFINTILFIFNLLPIYPLDGGRIVRDFLVLKMRNQRQMAIRIASIISLIFSILLLIYSIFSVSILLIFFSALFIYTAVKELQSLKN
jgi:Zn-dependent protease